MTTLSLFSRINNHFSCCRRSHSRLRFTHVLLSIALFLFPVATNTSSVLAKRQYHSNIRVRNDRVPFVQSKKDRIFGTSADSISRSRRNSRNTTLKTLVKLRAGSQSAADIDAENEDDVDVLVKENEDEVDDDDNDDGDEDIGSESAKTTTENKADSERLSTPVSVVLQAKFCRESSLLDQTVELTLQRRRSIAELKENLRRTLPNKPPVSLLKILYQGRVQEDDVLLDEILKSEEEDEDDDVDDDDNEEGESKGKLQLTLDMIPPVNGKFFHTLAEQLNDLTTAQLLRLYAANEAALLETSLSLLEIPDDNEGRSKNTNTEPVAWKIEERAQQIESQLREVLLRQDKVRTLLEETRPPSALHRETEIRGERVIVHANSKTAVVGMKATLRKKIQYHFNVQSWPNTIRNICLFIFFGLFGGRTPLSRFILLLCAPCVLLLQARPVKLFWKQLLYTLMIDPPGILLSLLPAPQQTIFHLDTQSAMQSLYGPYTTETRELAAQKEQSKNKKRIKARAKQTSSTEEEEFFDAEEEEFYDTKEEEEDDEEEEEQPDGDDDDDDW
ncbi:hypothetical protein ACA910_013001 [Epithemia clementina (nom. ined.)]